MKAFEHSFPLEVFIFPLQAYHYWFFLWSHLNMHFLWETLSIMFFFEGILVLVFLLNIFEYSIALWRLLTKRHVCLHVPFEAIFISILRLKTFSINFPFEGGWSTHFPFEGIVYSLSLWMHCGIIVMFVNIKCINMKIDGKCPKGKLVFKGKMNTSMISKGNPILKYLPAEGTLVFHCLLETL